MRNAAGALYTVNEVPAYDIGGNSELATSCPENSSNKEMFSVFVGRWWATMQPVRLTADCSMPVERRQRMIGRPELIAWQAGQSELLWLTSAGDGGPRRQLPGRYCQRGRMELCRWDSGTWVHRGETVSALGRQPVEIAQERRDALRRQVVRRLHGDSLATIITVTSVHVIYHSVGPTHVQSGAKNASVSQKGSKYFTT